MTGVNKTELKQDSPRTNSWFDVAQVLAIARRVSAGKHVWLAT
jgi:hypothetical protein